MTTPVDQGPRFASQAEVVERLRAAGYLADPRIGLTVFIADRLEKPILIEGPAGVGKTELTRTVAAVTGSSLIRLQCYEGLDESKALYEWKYGKQLLYTQILKDRIGLQLNDAPTMEAAMDRLHGMGDMFTCPTCHPKDYCDTCHGPGLPHTPDFRTIHPSLARDPKAKCTMCHRANFCADCNGGLVMPHPQSFLEPHDAAVVTEVLVAKLRPAVETELLLDRAREGPDQ